MSVDVPCAEDLLGDKLTAFAPNTTGIPYFKNGKSMSMEIIKQLYDVGCLFDLSNDMDIVRKTFERIAQKEIGYRSGTMAVTDVLEDILQTSLCISTRSTMGKGNFEELQNGIKRVKGFIFSESYHIENAIVSASKAAYPGPSARRTALLRSPRGPRQSQPNQPKGIPPFTAAIE